MQRIKSAMELRRRRWRFNWQPQPERASRVRFALHRNRAAKRLSDALADCEPDPGSVRGTWIEARELEEQLLLIRRRDSATGVRDL